MRTLGVTNALDPVRRQFFDADLPRVGSQRDEDLVELDVDRGGVTVPVVFEEEDEKDREHADEEMQLADAVGRDTQRRSA